MEEKLLTLYAKTKVQEARVHMYAMRAQRDNNKNLEFLCNTLAISLKAQAKRILYQIRGFIATTDENIDKLKTVEIPELISLHKEIGELAANNNKALETGSNHAKKINTLLTNLIKQAIEGGGTKCYHICDFCGYISKDTVPEKCPICTAAPSRFITTEL